MTPQIVGIFLKHISYALLLACVVLDGVWFRRHPDSVRFNWRELPVVVSRILLPHMRKGSTLKLWLMCGAFQFGDRLFFHDSTFGNAVLTGTGATLGTITLGLMIQLVPACIAGWLYGATGCMSSCPGWRLRRMAQWAFSHRTFLEILEPPLSDMQIDFMSALADGRPVKARWAQLRGYCVFWSHVFLQIPIDLTRVVAKLWKLGG